MTRGSGKEGTVISGRDEVAGGTWIGANRSGRIAVLTNIREPSNEQYTSSRGYLMSSFLAPALPRQTFQDYISELKESFVSYAGFNMLLISLDNFSQPDAAFVTNSGAGGKLTSRALTEEEMACGGLSNGIDGKTMDKWTKIQQGISLLQPIIRGSSAQNEDGLIESLLRILSTQNAITPRSLEDLRSTTLVPPLELEKSRYYATRLSTIILVRKDGETVFLERDIWKLDSDGKPIKGEPANDRKFRFKIDPMGI